VSAHTTTRLETPDETVIAYLAPSFEVTTVLDNDLFNEPRPRGKPSIVRDYERLSFEVDVQGQFEHSDNLPAGHVSDLETVFGHAAPITAREQVARIRRFTVDRSLINGIRAEPLHLYDDGDEYAYTGADQIDWSAGRYPPVTPKQVQPADEPGATRWQYTLSFQVGTPEGVTP